MTDEAREEYRAAIRKVGEQMNQFILDLDIKGEATLKQGVQDDETIQTIRDAIVNEYGRLVRILKEG